MDQMDKFFLETFGEEFMKEVKEYAERFRRLVNYELFLESEEALKLENLPKLIEDGKKALNLTDKDMATLIDVSIPTIQRWAKQETSPFPVLQKVVVEELLRETTRQIKDDEDDY